MYLMRFSSVFAFQGITCVCRKNSSEISLGKCVALVVESWGQNAAKSGAECRIFQKESGRLLRMLGGRSGKLGGRSGARKLILIFINPYSDGLLRRLVLVGFYISSSQRCFKKEWYQARSKERRKKTVLAHRNEEEEEYVIL